MSQMKTFVRSDNGGALMEFTLVISLLLTVTFGLVEFSLALFRWNNAAKAVQAGARLAAVSAPLSSDIKTMTGLSSTVFAGDPMPDFERICTGTGSSTGTCSGGGTYSSAAMNTLLYGRGRTVCAAVAAEQLPGMCNFLTALTPANITVTYKQTGLGFAGRPGGPVPTITVELTGLSFNFILLRMVPGITSITMPSMRSTITGEDLSTTN